MIDPDHKRPSIRRQCELVSISRASFYRQPAGETTENLELMRIIDEAFMETPGMAPGRWRGTCGQGSQFTSFAFTISMDGRGRWMDNVFIERLWRSLKYECVFLNAFETGSAARSGSVPGSTITIADAGTQHLAQDTRRALCYGRKDGAIGGVETNQIHLSQAAKLSH